MNRRNRAIASLILCIVPTYVFAVDGQRPPPIPLVYKSLRSNFGSISGNYVVPGKSVADQIIEALTGPRAPVERLGNGEYLLSGCRLHSCDEKAALIFLQSGEVVTVGLINFHCRRARTSRKALDGETCDREPKFDVFMHPTASGTDALQRLEKWGTRNGRVPLKIVRLHKPTPPYQPASAQVGR